MYPAFASLTWLQSPGLERRWWHLVCLGLLLLAVQAGKGSWAATERVLLRDDQPSVSVWPSVAVLPDPGGALSVLDAVVRMPEFAVPAGTSGTLGVRAGAVWVHVPLAVSATSNGLWIVDIDYPVLNHVEVYLIRGGQVTQKATLGSMHPFSQRQLRSRTHALALAVQPGQQYDLLLRVQTRGAMVLPITLNKPTAWHGAAMNEQMLQGLLTGLALCLLIYSLAQWINLREVLFIQYALLL
ncbi:MAG: GGDEF domain-containing protein, partial [Comamonadaceae bacterium]